MRRRSRPARTALASGVLAAVLGGAMTLAQTSEDRRILPTLGPDGFAGLPPLAVVVDTADAAIVGRVVGTGRLTVRDVPDSGSAQRNGVPYAGYRVAIDEVVFTRSPANAPPIAAGTELDMDMDVGRDSAERFLDRRIPVTSEDVCLLFLSARTKTWTVFAWHLQFRRVGDATATLGGAPFAAYAMTPEWHDGAVDLVQTPRGPALGWASLIAAVRELGGRPIERPRR
jgi:hypothetical protein